LKELSHLPVIADPSHGTGVRSLVTPMAKAAVAAGADGLIIEVHPNPEEAFSDGAQSLTPDQFATLMDWIRKLVQIENKKI
jgi:3-deoxy-7-phosphoheptulonate synthase